MKDIVTKVDGVSTYSADEFNPNMTELERAVINSGQTLDPTGTNLDQLSEAMGRYGGGGADFYSDSGAANAYVLTGVGPFIKSKEYFDGMMVRFVAGFSNTLPSTINVSTIGVVPLRDSTGTALGPNFIRLGATITATYDLAALEFRILGNGGAAPFQFIGLFAGAVANIPTGWALCDGNNGTPDLRNNFVRGAGGLFAPNAIGGSDVTGGHALSVAELAVHSHTYTARTGSVGSDTDDPVDSTAAGASSPVTATSSVGSGTAHTHPNTVPPFYALAYIMKL